MSMPTLDQLQRAAALVHQHMRPTPEYRWPLLCEHLGTELWVKHENHTITGAFKVRGGLTFMHWLKQTHPTCRGVITATRGNHGQSQARAAATAGLRAKIVVPHGNSTEKNQAMRALGGEVEEIGHDFDEARIYAAQQAEQLGLFTVPAYHEQIVVGVASYALELFTAQPGLDRVYVPIGCGSGICGLIAARDGLGLSTEIVGVVSTEADAAKRSFEAGRLVETSSADTFADGMAVRAVVPEAFDIYRRGVLQIVAVNDAEVAEAMRVYFRCTHNVAEGAGAAALAAAVQQAAQLRGKKVAVILTGGNVDTEVFQRVLAKQEPAGVVPKAHTLGRS